MDSVACLANIRGLTSRTKVWITPANDYPLPDNSQWDQNEPVRTNATANVLYDVPKVINPANQLDESIIDDKVMATEPDALKGKLSLYPNPTQNHIWIQSSDALITL